MAVKTNWLPWAIVLLAVALLGLLGIQFFWVQRALDLQRTSFDRAVNEALQQAVAKLEMMETADYVKNRMVIEFNQRLDIFQGLPKALRSPGQELPGDTTAPQDSLRYQLKGVKPLENGLQRFQLSVQGDPAEGTLYFPDSHAEDLSLEQRLGQALDVLQGASPPPDRPPAPGVAAEPRGDLFVREQRTRIVNDVVERYLRQPQPIHLRVDTSALARLLAAELHERDLTLPKDYQLAIDSLPSPNSPVPAPSSPGAYTARLFPEDLFSQAGYVTLRIPHKKRMMLGHFLWIPLLAAGFIALVLLAFGYVVRSLWQQKKLSAMKSDFINNMTHELKTPITTIGLAAEVIQELQPEGQAHKMAGTIATENKRLAGHVEQVLKLAELDRHGLTLSRQPTNVHTLLEQVAQSFALPLQKRNGTLTLALNATKATVWADTEHLTNVLHNLVDNALKYSPEAPRIILRTRNTARSLEVSVQDHGLGMDRSTAQRVFERFYRAPTGNRHDVKGFGLGLSYVKSIVEAHGGSVRVRSTLGKGSTFIVSLPTDPPP